MLIEIVGDINFIEESIRQAILKTGKHKDYEIVFLRELLPLSSSNANRYVCIVQLISPK